MTQIVMESSRHRRGLLGNDPWHVESPSPVGRTVTEVADNMNEILLVGLVAIAVVIVMAGLLGRLVDRDDLQTYVER
jgi:hypothetical protein